jgi:hypothetical protein
MSRKGQTTVAERWEHIVECARNETPIPEEEQLQGHVALASLGIIGIRNADEEGLKKLRETFFAMSEGAEDVM